MHLQQAFSGCLGLSQEAGSILVPCCPEAFVATTGATADICVTISLPLSRNLRPAHSPPDPKSSCSLALPHSPRPTLGSAVIASSSVRYNPVSHAVCRLLPFPLGEAQGKSSFLVGTTKLQRRHKQRKCQCVTLLARGSAKPFRLLSSKSLSRILCAFGPYLREGRLSRARNRRLSP